MKKAYVNPLMTSHQIKMQTKFALEVSPTPADDTEVLDKERNDNLWEEF